MPDKINIYRLYDPLDIQLMKLDIEAAAAKVPTGDFVPGYMECTVFDNGFWTLENTMPPISGLSFPSSEGLGVGSGVGGVEEARTAAEQWMRSFDEILQGKQPENPYHQTESYQQMLASIHPDYRDSYQPKSTKPAKQKPKFFENTVYIGGRSVNTEINGQKQVYYRLVYGVQVKPSKDEEAVMILDKKIQLNISLDGVLLRLEYICLPIKTIEEEERTKNPAFQNMDLVYAVSEEDNRAIPYFFEETKQDVSEIDVN